MTLLDDFLGIVTLFVLEDVDYRQKCLGRLAEVLVVVVIKLKPIEEAQEISEGVKEGPVARYFVDS